MKSLCLKHTGCGLKEERGAHILDCLTKGRGLEVSLSGVSEIKDRASHINVSSSARLEVTGRPSKALRKEQRLISEVTQSPAAASSSFRFS